MSDPWLSHIYRPHWQIIPNLATDLLLPPLLSVLPLHIAGRIILALAMLLPLCGTLIYNRAVFGRHLYWPLASALVAYNVTFLLGFLNFLFGIETAFAMAAIWVRWRQSHAFLAVLVASAGIAVVFFCHLIALPLVAALIAGYETDQMCSPVPQPNPVGRLIAACSVFLPAIVLYTYPPTMHAVGPTTWLPAVAKPLLSIGPVMNYSYGFDFATA